MKYSHDVSKKIWVLKMANLWLLVSSIDAFCIGIPLSLKELPFLTTSLRELMMF